MQHIDELMKSRFPLQVYKKFITQNYELNQSENSNRDWTEWEDVTDEHGFQEF